MQEDNPYYPLELQRAEAELLNWRRQGATGAGAAQARAGPVGVSLSGGGIRSATFCLGIFQGLAKRGLLQQVDFLSTVSGGGYFGSFLGRLFHRQYIQSCAQVEGILTGNEGPAEPAEPDESSNPRQQELGQRRREGARWVFRWLRENGRYLSPRGAGDLLLAGAVLLRNFVAIHLVLATLALWVFLTLQGVRGLVELRWGMSPVWHAFQNFLVCGLPWGESLLNWSPTVGLLPLPLLILVIPLGWAYWMVERRTPHFLRHPLTGLAAVFLLTTLGILTLRQSNPRIYWGSWLVLGAAVLTFAAWLLARVFALRSAVLHDLQSPDQREMFRDEKMRFLLSSWLKSAFLITGVGAALVLIDTLGQTLYVLALQPGQNLGGWGGAMTGLLTAVAAFGREILIKFGAADKERRIPLPLSMVSSVAAILIALFVLGGINTLSHAIAWKGLQPLGVAERSGPVRLPLRDATSLTLEQREARWTLAPTVDDKSGCTRSAPVTGRRQSLSDLDFLGVSWGIALLFTLLFGQVRNFFNRSSHHALYSARLTRAYLGASNPARHLPKGGAVTELIPRDDIPDTLYWWSAQKEQLYKKGAPLHLINVTINETVDGRSQVQQQDRKGTGMAIGPGGFSVGRGHHAVLETVEEKAAGQPHQKLQLRKVYPAAQQHSHPPYRVFEVADRAAVPFEPLSLGQWAAISGAAFSTGLGARTNLGLSILAGMANIRLGYWWGSGIDPAARIRAGTQRAMKPLRWLLWKLLPVQTYLLSEFAARFPGSALKDWYLSDGGHFENLGAYELIRRRLPLILAVDAEADPDFKFEGLANLVRKARLDFDAEITFLNRAQLEQTVSAQFLPYFGTLEEMSRARATPGSAVAPSAGSAAPPRDPRGPHAALAQVSYSGQTVPGSWLFYIKATLSGDESADVAEYYARHPSFPHESTGDQFFDEAQWESYRRLGEHIASSLFASSVGLADDGFVPSRFTPPSSPSLERDA